MHSNLFFESFSVLEDKREQGKVKHKLIDILFIVVSAVMCGCNEWKEITWWTSSDTNIMWLKKYIELPNGTPSLSTMVRLFNILDPKQFEKCFADWIGTAINLPEKDIISIDGKTMRGTIEKGHTTGVHIVNALCSSRSLVIGQVKTDVKSNEITAIPELLDMLQLKGCIVTTDAMGCQRKIAEKIIKEKKADYVLQVKGNQGDLLDDIMQHFRGKEVEIENLKKEYSSKTIKEKMVGDTGLAYTKTVEKGHGRIEKREYIFSTDIGLFLNAKKEWVGLNGVGMVVRETIVDDVMSREASFFIGSISSIFDFKKAVRNHWLVESMHWSLDFTYKDDANRTRKGTAPQNMAVLKRIAFNIAKKDTIKYPKESMKGKRFLAGLHLDYRDFLLALSFKAE